MNFGRSINLSLKYQSFTPSSSRDIGFKKSEFATKTHFLYVFLVWYTREVSDFRILNINNFVSFLSICISISTHLSTYLFIYLYLCISLRSGHEERSNSTYITGTNLRPRCSSSLDFTHKYEERQFYIL